MRSIPVYNFERIKQSSPNLCQIPLWGGVARSGGVVKKEVEAMTAKAYVLPPIRADTANMSGEPQLLKKRLKMERQYSKRNDGMNFFMEGVFKS